MSISARDALRALADEDGITLDAEVVRLTRTERQRRMGLALAAVELDDAEARWLEVGCEAVRDAGR